MERSDSVDRALGNGRDFLTHRIGTSEILPCVRKSFLPPLPI